MSRHARRRRPDRREQRRRSAGRHTGDPVGARGVPPGGARPPAGPRPDGPGEDGGGAERRAEVDWLIAQASGAAADASAAMRHARRLEHLMRTDGPGLVVGRLVVAVEETVRSCWQRGWQPAEVFAAVRRKLGPGEAGLVATAVVADLVRYPPSRVDPRWVAQVRSLEKRRTGPAGDVGGLFQGLNLLACLRRLPRLPLMCPLPGSAPASSSKPTDGRMLQKVRALLAKAESTAFAEEADALTAKAQELMLRHSLDSAVVAGTAPASATAASTRRIWIEDPYFRPKSLLLDVVAIANQCRTVVFPGYGFATVAGHSDDLETVDVLFTSLLVQASTHMTRAGSRADVLGRSRTRAFRASFLTAYADRIGDRLAEAAASARAWASGTHGVDLLPVVRSRAAAAAAVLDELFPHTRALRTTASDGEGWAAGTAAADLADLGTRRPLADAG